MAMPSVSRTPSLALWKLHLVRITKVGTRAASSASGASIDTRPRTSRPSSRLTVFTEPNATKRSVISRITGNAFAPDSEKEERAAVILASPRHASWLTDKSFMSELVSALEKPSAVGSNFHVLAAVVDGLSPHAPSRELQEGLSIHLGHRNSLLPGLWEQTSLSGGQQTLTQRAEPDSSSSLSVLLPQHMTAKDARISLTLPLANTLFHTGRRSTLLVSEWAHVEDDSKGAFELVRMADKQVQVVDLPPTAKFDKLNIRAPLVPITEPREVLEGLGNILAKVKANGEPSPASKELQINIPRLLDARRALTQSEAAAGRVGVWAVIYPRHMFGAEEDLIRFYQSIGGRFLGTALGKLAFDMSNDPERVAWEIQPVFRNAVFQGARIHRILSGGGEWGAKARLLSLDPQTRHGRESEEDELDRFIRSFHSEDNAKDAIAKPGDYVQFFVERDPVQLAPEKKDNLAVQSIDYPPVLFGVGDTNMKDIDSANSSVESRGQVQTQGKNRLVLDHFGGYSAEGIYLSAGDVGPNTKMDVPGASVSTSTAKGASNNSGPYRPFVRVDLHST